MQDAPAAGGGCVEGRVHGAEADAVHDIGPCGVPELVQGI